MRPSKKTKKLLRMYSIWSLMWLKVDNHPNGCVLLHNTSVAITHWWIVGAAWHQTPCWHACLIHLPMFGQVCALPVILKTWRVRCRQNFHQVCFGTLGALGLASSPPHTAVPPTIRLAFPIVAAFKHQDFHFPLL